MELSFAVVPGSTVRLNLAFSSHLQKVKETLEDMEDEGNFLRRSVNDITSLLDINFGSLGRPSRGGRGRGARGGVTTRPERPKPILERVCSTLRLKPNLLWTKNASWVFNYDSFSDYQKIISLTIQSTRILEKKSPQDLWNISKFDANGVVSLQGDELAPDPDDPEDFPALSAGR